MFLLELLIADKSLLDNVFNKVPFIFAFILFSIINIGIAYFITSSLGIQNVILLQSYTAMNYVITYEVLIFLTLFYVPLIN